MTGVGFGTLDGSISQRISRWDPSVIRAARRNIQNFKQYRHLLLGRVCHLTPQTSLYVPEKGDSDQWDMVEYVNQAGSEAVVFIFRGGAEQAIMRPSLKGLKADAHYVVKSLNTGQQHAFSGTTISEAGVEVTLPSKDTSEIFLVRQI